MFNCNLKFLVAVLAGQVILQASSPHAKAATISFFTPGDIVVSVEGNGSGTGVYIDNQAAPLSLYEFGLNNTNSVNLAGSMQLPQTASGANSAISGEYGSSSEGALQLSGNGKYLTIMGYGVNANAFNVNPGSFSPISTNTALGQSGSMTGQSYTTVPRVVALISANGSVDTSTAVNNVFNTNNPRSAYTVDGQSFYISGQGSGSDHTAGVFFTTLGSTSATPITGDDTTGKTVSQDTREVQVVNNTLLVSADTKGGSNSARDIVGTLGSPGTPPTALANSSNGPIMLPGFGNSGGTGKQTITSATTNGVNSPGQQVNLSPENFFFANPTTLYVADSGFPKNDSATNHPGGDGGLQKWSLVSGSWALDYTVSAGLNLIANSASSGTTGLYGLTGELVTINGLQEVELFATNFTVGDTDQTFLYGLTDLLSATIGSDESFTQLFAAPTDTTFKGVAFAPVDPTPLPAALPLFATGLGALGLLAKRRKRKVAAAMSEV